MLRHISMILTIFWTKTTNKKNGGRVRKTGGRPNRILDYENLIRKNVEKLIKIPLKSTKIPLYTWYIILLHKHFCRNKNIYTRVGKREEKRGFCWGWSILLERGAFDGFLYNHDKS